MYSLEKWRKELLGQQDWKMSPQHSFYSKSSSKKSQEAHFCGYPSDSARAHGGLDTVKPRGLCWPLTLPRNLLLVADSVKCNLFKDRFKNIIWYNLQNTYQKEKKLEKRGKKKKLIKIYEEKEEEGKEEEKGEEKGEEERYCHEVS